MVDRKGSISGVGKATIRTLTRILEVNPFLAGGIPAGLVAGFSKSHQRLGDMAAGTFVLKTSDLPRLVRVN